MERLEAGVLGTIFRNEENGYSVVSIRVGRQEATATGVLPELAPGEQVLLGGNDTSLAMCHSCWKKRIARERSSI